mgnify:FL=1
MRSILTVTAAATQANRRLCTLAAVKQQLAITVSTYDAALTALIDAASAAIARYCDRGALAQETVTEEWRNVYQETPLITERRPITDVESVVVDGTTLAEADYQVDAASGHLWRLADDERVWWSARKVVVTYTAGFLVPDQEGATLPLEIAQAAVITVAAWRKGEGRDPMLRSNSADGIGASSWVATADMGALPPQAEALLRDHVTKHV